MLFASTVFQFDLSTLLGETLPILAKGMLGTFVVMLLLIGVVSLLRAVTKKKAK